MQTARLDKKIRVLIVEDQPQMRKGIHSLIDLQPDMVVCGESEGVSDALLKIAEQRPDVASVDINLGLESGLDLTRQIRALNPAVKVLVLSSHDDRWHIQSAAKAGAHAYVTKLAASETLTDAIRGLMLPETRQAFPTQPHFTPGT